MPFRTEASVLQDARDLIADPKRWTQGAGARTAEGYNTCATSAEAVSFCAIGAVVHVTDGKPNLKVPALEALRRIIVGDSFATSIVAPVTTFNDTRSHAEVLALFDRAIASVRQDAEVVG